MYAKRLTKKYTPFVYNKLLNELIIYVENKENKILASFDFLKLHYINSDL